jgi:hypothetical protein
MTLYQLVIAHADEEGWASEVETHIRAACAGILGSDAALIAVPSVNEAIASDAPTLVVCLGSAAAASSRSVYDELELARQNAFVVIPLKHAGDDVASVFPAILHTLNAVDWDGDKTALSLLRALGVVESERRLFLSYRRAEASALALQIRRSLSERLYDVFLDRFSVPPGEDFQRRIDIELADKAFVLLLESEGAIGSEWVQHEVSYALSNRIPVLALALPGVDAADRFAVVDEAFRLRLEPTDLASSNAEILTDTDQILTEPALQRVLDAVEWRYARSLRRRREQLIGSASDFLLRAGFERATLDEWALLATRGEERLAVSVAPRAPRPEDVRVADRLRHRLVQTYGEECVRGGWVVHDTHDRHPPARELVEWIVSDRPLETVVLQDLQALAEVTWP